ncbi:hypothetical protein H4582DRAFT_2189549 [Lactarius indigo]|nr:hypothetical protein H4582DRAFT_2189549 [Lactarius indigo]
MCPGPRIPSPAVLVSLVLLAAIDFVGAKIMALDCNSFLNWIQSRPLSPVYPPTHCSQGIRMCQWYLTASAPTSVYHPPPTRFFCSTSGSRSNTGTIAGSIDGGIVALSAIGALLFYFLRKQQCSQVPSVVVDGVTPPMSQQRLMLPKKPVVLIKLYPRTGCGHPPGLGYRVFEDIQARSSRGNK